MQTTDGKTPTSQTPAPLNARDNPDWWRERNERRRERYRLDEAYRAQQQDSSRKAYRTRSGGEEGVSDPRDNLRRLDNFGKVRPVTFPDGRKFDRWCMTKGEVAAIFGRAVKLFYSWVNDGRFPGAVLTAVDHPITRDYKTRKGVQVPQTVEVYAMEEVRAAVEVLGAHLARVRYYRADHEREREQLFAAVDAARKSIGIQTKEV